MRFVGRVAIILVVVVAAAAAHSLEWPIYRDLADIRARTGAGGVGPRVEPSTSDSQGGSDEQPVLESTSDEDTGGSEPQATGATDVQPPAAVDPGESTEPLPEYYITVDEAFDLWDEGMPFVDARTDRERAEGTVEGAIHLETRHFIDGTAASKLAMLDPAFPVIVFCGGGDCDASENVAKRLLGWGFEEIYVMHEGYGQWAEAGHPTEPAGGN